MFLNFRGLLFPWLKNFDSSEFSDRFRNKFPWDIAWIDGVTLRKFRYVAFAYEFNEIKYGFFAIIIILYQKKKFKYKSTRKFSRLLSVLKLFAECAIYLHDFLIFPTEPPKFNMIN